jgi:hypothetical protein
MGMALLAMLSSRYLPDVVALGVFWFLQSLAAIAFMFGPAARAKRVSPWTRRALILIAWAASGGVVTLGFMFRFRRVANFLPSRWGNWVHGAAIMWALFAVLMIAAYAVAALVPRSQPEHSPGRRAFLQTAKAAVLTVPAAVVGYGAFVQRFQLGLREQDIHIPGLPPDLAGLRIAQLTDIHLSPFLSVRELQRAVDMANETRPDITLVTGDLITGEDDPLDDCLHVLSRLRAISGVFGCMGNHEIVAGSEHYTQVEGARLGLNFLRQQSVLLRFGAADLNLAGVDYQRSHKRYLRGAERLAVPGAFNVLLSHNPDVFPTAVRKGFPLTIAGHTHGGQVRVEILGQDLNVARFYTPYVDGLYRQDKAAVFVSRGIGTIGLPARLGAPPEVALLKLCRT